MSFHDVSLESLESVLAEAVAAAAAVMQRFDSQLWETICTLVEGLELQSHANNNAALLFVGAPSWCASESLSNYSKYRGTNTERHACTIHWFDHRDKPPCHDATGKGDSLLDFKAERQNEWRRNDQVIEPDNLNWQQRVYNWWRSWKKKRPIAAAFLVALFPVLLQSCVNNATEIAKPMEPRLEDAEAVITHKFEGDQVFVINGDATFIINGVPQKEQGNMQQDKQQFGGMILDSLPEDSSVVP